MYKHFHITGLVALLVAMVFASCSTQKNTGASRAFHSMKVRYNIYYNGDVAYQEGLQEQARAHTDDYAHVLPLYTVSDHKAAEASKSKMDLTIEKCRKCIKLHSIKKRPQVNQKKMTDPKYKAWLKQEEFNPSMYMAWLRLGQAEFQKGDFMGSISTMSYVIRHFSYDKDLVAQCQLWQVRAYAEMGWLYEADDLLRKVNIDDLSYKHAPLYSAVTADLLTKQERYREAIPHVVIAKADEDRKTSRPRLEYVLGQLYELDGKRADALAAYKRVKKLQPEWIMQFNADLRITELQTNTDAALRQLDKMIKRDKYANYLDQLFGAKGNILLRRGDTLLALAQYDSAAVRSTQNGPEKAAILVKAGDIRFDRQDYAKAEPCYTEAVTIISAESPEYARIKKRQEVLGGLVQYQQQWELQDSLQHLATLSEEEQMKVAEKIIADLIEQEKRDSIAEAQAARAQANGTAGGPRSVNTSNMLGGSGGSANWYFYNPNLMKQGKQQFRQKWGNRTLEDNWRRKIKTVSGAFFEDENTDDDTLSADTDSLGTQNDSLTQQQPLATDPHDPQYYLQQIPRTQEDLQQSDTLIAEALYNLVGIYRDQLEDSLLAAQTYDELKRRYPYDSRVGMIRDIEALRALMNDPVQAAQLRQEKAAADSLYEATYLDYKAGRYAEVKQAVNQVDAQVAQQSATTSPLTTLMPRFLFLRSVATAKTDGQNAFVEELRTLVERYPESEMSAMAKDMLSMMNQGFESQKGGKMSGLEEQRNLQVEEEKAAMEAEKPQEKQVPRVVISLPQSQQNLNKLLYEVALYNFSKFMIKDFDLDAQLKHVDATATEPRSALVITGFETEDDVLWYKGLLMENTELLQIINSLQATIE